MTESNSQTSKTSKAGLWNSVALGLVAALIVVPALHLASLFLAQSINDASYWMVFNFAPEVLACIAAGVLILYGKERTALGVFLGLGLMVGLVLLLVAACFGLFSMA